MYYLNLTDVYLRAHLFYSTKVQAVKENTVSNHCNVKYFFKSLCLCWNKQFVTLKYERKKGKERKRKRVSSEGIEERVELFKVKWLQA